MSDTGNIDFGDTVRVRTDPATEALGLAGLTGQVYGLTTPFVTGIEVIGSPKEDLAANVYFETRDGAFWFASHWLEFVERAPGTEIRLEGVPKSWVRAPDGTWIERRDSPLKRWWQFWK